MLPLPIPLLLPTCSHHKCYTQLFHAPLSSTPEQAAPSVTLTHSPAPPELAIRGIIFSHSPAPPDPATPLYYTQPSPVPPTVPPQGQLPVGQGPTSPTYSMTKVFLRIFSSVRTPQPRPLSVRKMHKS